MKEKMGRGEKKRERVYHVESIDGKVESRWCESEEEVREAVQVRKALRRTVTILFLT